MSTPKRKHGEETNGAVTTTAATAVSAAAAAASASETGTKHAKTDADSKSSTSAAIAIDRSTHPDPMHFIDWITTNKAAFLPPVSNKLINGKGCQFKIMVVAGPNTRTDYHINRGEEWFYMVKGDMILKVVDGGRFRDIVIREGEAFCLPSQIPHSPQRYSDTYGLVLEHDRYAGELDGLRWYCRHCSTTPQTMTTVYETFFVCEDLGSQLKERINKYYGDEKQRTCVKCNTVDQKLPFLTVQQAVAQAEINNTLFASQTPDSKAPAINPKTHPNPFKVQPIFDALKAGAVTSLTSVEWKAYAVSYGAADAKTNKANADSIALHTASCEEWVWQWSGAVTFSVLDAGVLRSITVKEGEIYLIPRGVPRSLPHVTGSGATASGVFVTLNRIGGSDSIAVYDLHNLKAAPKHRTEFVISDDPLKEIKHHYAAIQL